MSVELIDSIFSLVVLFFSIVIHEVAHGSVAYYLGDPTAKRAGRLTINPLVHIDLFGTIILPFFLFLMNLPLFGWAKPVPVNPNNFKDRKWGNLKVSLAGPLSNILVGVIFSLMIRMDFGFLNERMFAFFTIIAIYNFALALFNLIPIPPLDGHHILFSLLPSKFFKFKVFLKQYGTLILFLFLFVFNFSFIFLGARSLYLLIAGF